MEHRAKMGLKTQYLCCLEGSYSSEKTKKCSANQLTGFYMTMLALKGLNFRIFSRLTQIF